MNIITPSVIALLFGALLVVGSGTSFGGNIGVIIFCYGVFGLIYTGLKKIFD